MAQPRLRRHPKYPYAFTFVDFKADTAHLWIEYVYARASGSNRDPRIQLREVIQRRRPRASIGLLEKSTPAGKGLKIKDIVNLVLSGDRVSLSCKRVDRIAHDLAWGFRFARLLLRPNFRLFFTHEKGCDPRKPISKKKFERLLVVHFAHYCRKVEKMRKTNAIRTPPRRGSIGYRKLESGEVVFDSPERFRKFVAPPFEERLKIDSFMLERDSAVAAAVAKKLRKRRLRSLNGQLWNARKVLHAFRQHKSAFCAWKLLP